MNIQELLGYNLRRVRSDKNLTQEELSAKSRISQQYISELESGQRNPSLVLVSELADALEILPAELLRSAAGQRLTKVKRKRKKKTKTR